MIEPPPARRISGTTTLVPRYVPLAWTSIWPSHSSSVVSSTPPRAPVPALFTSTSSFPNESTAVLTAPSQSTWHVTSRRTKTAWPPSSRISDAVLSPASTSMSPSTTFAPSATNSHAAAPPKPIISPLTPWAPPVINATFPSSLISSPPMRHLRPRLYQADGPGECAVV